MTLSAAAFAIAFTVVWLLTPLVERVARRCGALDLPVGRKVHYQATPTWGGIAIVLAIAAGVLIPLPLTRPLVGVLLAAAMLMIVGAIDDVAPLPPLFKLLAQVGAACFLILFDIRIAFISLPWSEGITYLNTLESWGATVAWVVVITNTINLIDGLDGLAAGVSGIASCTLCLMALQAHVTVEVAALAAAVCGASIGFLRFNFNPARIFMGDAGSMVLGMLLSAIAVMGALKTPTTVTIIVPILVLGVPVVDTVFAIIRRLLTGQSVFHADRGHLHHRLLDRGLNQRQAVIFIYIVSVALCLAAWALSRSG